MNYNRLLATNDIRSISMSSYIVIAMCAMLLQVTIGYLFDVDNTIVLFCGYIISLMPVIMICIHFTKACRITADVIFYLLIVFYQCVMVVWYIINASADIPATIAKVASSWSLITVLFTFRYQLFSKRTIDLLLILNVMVTLICILIYFSDVAHKYGSTELEWLTLNMGNSNYTAVMLLGNFEILYMTILYVKRSRLKVVLFCLSVFVLFMIYETKSRMAFGIAILFILFNLSKIKIKKWHIAVCVAAPLLFCIVYSLCGSIPGIKDITILGKPLFSGRIKVWGEHFDMFYNGIRSILFGNFGAMQLQNSHNGFLVEFFNYGLIGAAVYFIYLYKGICSYNMNSNDKIGKTAIFVVLSFVLVALTEGMTMTTGRDFSLFYIIAIAMTMREGVENEQQERAAKSFD